jgi:hypothetical protein
MIPKRIPKRVVNAVRAYAESQGCMEFDGHSRFYNAKGDRLIRVETRFLPEAVAWDTAVPMGIVVLGRAS